MRAEPGFTASDRSMRDQPRLFAGLELFRSSPEASSRSPRAPPSSTTPGAISLFPGAITGAGTRHTMGGGSR
jgi:hypothetical protein